MSRLKTIFLLVALLEFSGAAAEERLIDVRVDDRVPAGKQPSLKVEVHRPLAVVKVKLSSDRGEAFEQQRRGVNGGEELVFSLPARPGRSRWRGVLAVELAEGGGGEMKLDFETEVVESLGLRLERNRLDLEQGTLEVAAQRPLARLEYRIISESGALISGGRQRIEPPVPRAVIKWKPAAEKVMKITLLAEDASGLSQPLEITPWSYSIPHEEVIFPSGSWEIPPEERPKLERSYQLLQEGLRKYGKLLEIKLYIAGYTDTVAGADYNQQLSERRARAIAEFFRSRGFSYPIYYQGFGERALKVPTPDETDEPRNRRAEYVLAAEPPPLDVPGAEGGWKKL